MYSLVRQVDSEGEGKGGGADLARHSDGVPDYLCAEHLSGKLNDVGSDKWQACFLAQAVAH